MPRRGCWYGLGRLLAARKALVGKYEPDHVAGGARVTGRKSESESLDPAPAGVSLEV